MRKLRRLFVLSVAVFLTVSIVYFFVHVSSRIFPSQNHIISDAGVDGQLHSISLGSFKVNEYLQLPSDADRKAPYDRHGFHIINSRNVPWDRQLPDLRNQVCQKHSGLPSTSVVIAFHNEDRSVLLRTVLSVLRRSPPHLIHEIILIDDFSDNEDDGKQLELIPQVTLYRNKQREGAIRSRVWGAEMATGDVITFLDSHCEVNRGWLEPLLHRIKEDPLVIAVPVLDIISSSSFELSPSAVNIIGGFDWSLKFKWENLPTEDYTIRQEADPLKTPVIYGAAFSVHKITFDRMGKYDTGMEIQGAENIELSLRTWMCGGSVEVIPCSRVGHVNRKRAPYSFPDGSTSMYIRYDPWFYPSSSLEAGKIYDYSIIYRYLLISGCALFLLIGILAFLTLHVMSPIYAKPLRRMR